MLLHLRNGFNTLYSNEVRIGNNDSSTANHIVLNGEWQSKAYTNELHAFYMANIQQLSDRVKQNKLDFAIAPNNRDGSAVDITEWEPISYLF